MTRPSVFAHSPRMATNGVGTAKHLGHQHKTDKVGTKRAKDRVVEFLRATAPINAWLAKHVGDSDLVDSRS